MSKTITQKEKCYRCGGAIEFWEIRCGACGSEVPKGPRDLQQDAQQAYSYEMKARLNRMPTQAADERQVDGKHYKDLKVQPWTVMEAILTRPEFIGYLKGCIIKYGMRQDRKENSPEDGEKCRHYIEKLREMEQIHRITARA